MENTTTRIADLPENIMMQSPEMSTQYAPMNIHPNPYGNNPQNPPFLPNPQQTTAQKNPPQYPNNGPQIVSPPMPQIPGPQSQYMSEEQQMYIKQMQNQRLPSRDIPQDTTEYTQDEQIQPNFIPRPAPSIQDYVRDQEKTTEKNMREYQEKKKRENHLDSLITEFQTPIIVALLFFIFQMPIVSTLVFKRIPFLTLYNDDGNFNFNGLLFKSALFGIAYYSVLKGTFFLSEM